MKNANKIKEMLKIAEEAGVAVDRWNNIKWFDKTVDKGYRYNIKKNVLRYEVHHPELKLYTRLQSVKISSINLESWKSCMETLADKHPK